ncbi:MAG TPA: methyltransferase domain-containing protein [Gemmatimonadales bacterium]|nr:methyltransferase domain-containing protein [Gemmatimonadales bacterium]
MSGSKTPQAPGPGQPQNVEPERAPAPPRVTTSPALYDQLWELAWGDVQAHGPVHRHTIEQLVRLIRAIPVRSVLDVGCGAGDLLAALHAERRYDLAGADLSEAALTKARARVPSGRFYTLDIQRARLPQSFDLVVSVQVLEHLVDDIAALCNMGAMAKRFVLFSTVLGRMRRSEIRIGHVRNYSVPEIQQKLAAAGLTPIQIRRWGFPFYSPLYRTLVEYLPGGPPLGSMGRLSRGIAHLLYHLYRANWPGRGDIVTVLAAPQPI